MRHAYASNVLDAGGTLDEVQDLLGHASDPARMSGPAGRTAARRNPVMTATDCRGLRHAEPRRGRSRVLVVEYGSGRSPRSGVVILSPEPDAPDAAHRAAQAVREFAVATGPDHYRRAEELVPVMGR
jgi:hypothetical protein